jgi:tetratricopeptide (TPR) repeat protein
MAIFNRGLLLFQTGDYKGAIKDYTRVIKEYPNFLVGYKYRAEAKRKIGDLRGAEQDDFKVLKAELDKINGVKKNTASNKNTRKKSDKDMDNYGKIVVADNDEDGNRYKSDYRGRVQDKNITITPQPMFALTYYEKNSDVKRQINFYKYIEELNAKKEFSQRLIITNEEAPLSESQVKKHFASINDLSTVIDDNQGVYHKRFARAMDFYLVQDFVSSIGDLDKMIASQPTFFPSYFMRALIHYKQLEYRKMEKQYDLNPNSEEDKPVKAVDYDIIKQDLDKVIELVPDFVYGYYNRANIYSLMKDYRAALVDYDKAIHLDPNFADAYFNRGLVNIYLGNNRQGILDLSKAGELGLFSAYNIIKRFTDRKE